MFASPIAPEIAYLLMFCGACFAMSGLWLILRPRAQGASARLEIFGMKFESSSAGVLVFLIGAVFLAVPLFAKVDRAPPKPPAEPGPQADEQQQPGTANPSRQIATDIPRALRAVGAELEPNDNFAEANEIEIGAIIEGSAGSGNPDYFSFPASADFTGAISVNAMGKVRFSIYNDLGKRIPTLPGTFTDQPEYPRYFVMISSDDRNAPYTLTVAARPD